MAPLHTWIFVDGLGDMEMISEYISLRRRV